MTARQFLDEAHGECQQITICQGGLEQNVLQVVHGWLAATGFGVLIPLGIVIARTWKVQPTSCPCFMLYLTDDLPIVRAAERERIHQILLMPRLMTAQEFDPWWFHLHRLVVMLGAQQTSQMPCHTHHLFDMLPGVKAAHLR